MRRDAADARHPPFDARGRDQQQLVGDALVVGSAAPHAAPRAIGRAAAGDRVACVSRAARRSEAADAAVHASAYLGSAFFFHSSHGRGTVPPTEASARRASSSSRYVTVPPSAMACAWSRAFISV